MPFFLVQVKYTVSTKKFFIFFLTNISIIFFYKILKDALKTFGDIRTGIYTQAIEDSSISRQRSGYDQLMSNICLKINAKLGGKNFQLSKNDQ